MGGLKRVLENLRAQAGPDGPNLADIIEAQKIDVDQLRAWDGNPLQVNLGDETSIFFETVTV